MLFNFSSKVTAILNAFNHLDVCFSKWSRDSWPKSNDL